VWAAISTRSANLTNHHSAAFFLLVEIRKKGEKMSSSDGYKQRATSDWWDSNLDGEVFGDFEKSKPKAKQSEVCVCVCFL
jgi:hypothetical protein